MTLTRYTLLNSVQAAKISRIEQSPADEIAPPGSGGTWRLYYETDDGLTGDYIIVTHVWVGRHKPQVGGYFVRDEDEYERYMSAAAFERSHLSVELAQRQLRGQTHAINAVDELGSFEAPESSKELRGQTRTINIDDELGYFEVPAGMAFGTALDLVIGGKRARRRDWATGTFIYFVPGSTFAVNREPLTDFYPEGTVINYRPHVDIHALAPGGKHICAVYEPNQADTMAYDWQVLEKV